MQPALERDMVVSGVVFLALAALVEVTGLVRRRPSFAVTAACYAGATAFFLVTIAGRWVRESQGPFLTLYDILLSNGFSLALLLLLITCFVASARAALLFVSPLLLLMGIWLLDAPVTAVPLPATFDNYWLWAHVVSGKIFLGFCIAATGIAVALLLRGMMTPQRSAYLVPDPERAEQTLWSLFFIAFVCHSFMLVAGSVWAHTAWGKYWSWDPLETWTLVTWLILGGILHARATFRRMPAGLGHALVVASFAVAFLTFFGVPFFSIAPHKGLM